MNNTLQWFQLPDQGVFRGYGNGRGIWYGPYETEAEAWRAWKYMTSSGVRKPLKTREEIDAAYPEHAKMRALEPQIKALEDFLYALRKQDVMPCSKHIYETQEGEEEVWKPDTKFDFPSHAMQDFIWTHVGLDPQKIWWEKGDMLDQLQLFWEATEK